jgi:hypothetical protein
MSKCLVCDGSGILHQFEVGQKVCFICDGKGTIAEQPQSKFRLENHIVGKVYDLTPENMNAMLDAINTFKEQLTINDMCDASEQLRIRHRNSRYRERPKKGLTTMTLIKFKRDNEKKVFTFAPKNHNHHGLWHKFFCTPTYSIRTRQLGFGKYSFGYEWKCGYREMTVVKYIGAIK